MKRNKPYWFKAKNYGWGWFPATWQGWLILFVWIGIFAGFTAAFNVFLDFSWLAPVLSVLVGFLWAGVLFWISYKTGEKPHWQWGNKRDTDKK